MSNLRLINSHAAVGIAAMFAVAQLLKQRRAVKREPTTYRTEFQLAFVKAVIEQQQPYQFGVGQAVIVSERKLDSHLRLAFVDGKYVPAVEWVSVDKPGVITSRFRRGGRNYYQVYGHRILVFEAFAEGSLRADWTPASLSALRGYKTVGLEA